MPSFGMLCHVAVVRTNISEECSKFLCSVRRLLVTANVHSSPILVALMMEALLSSETLVLTRATQHNISEDGTIQNVDSDWNLDLFALIITTTNYSHMK
jgi:hypothetical protein